jgi:parallel beta-helix repeat protein
MSQTTSPSRAIALITLVTLSLQLFSPLVEITFANDTTYYVDATLGSDANDGLTLGTPWQSLTHVSAQAFLPGDQILLKCGETWTDPLAIDDSGISGSQIVIGSYDSCTESNKPVLGATGATNMSFLSGASYVTLSGITFPSTSLTQVDLSLGGTNIIIQDSDFTSGGTGILLGANTDVSITHNTFKNIVGASISVEGAYNTSISENYFVSNLTGSTLGVSLGASSSGSAITSNIFSGGNKSITLTDADTNTINSNTFYNPQESAISIVSTTLGSAENNTIDSNTILTWHPDHPMILTDDQVDDSGTLATFSANTYLNTYKAIIPLVEMTAVGTGAQNYTKDDIMTLDTSALTFTHFGYKNYTSTGVLNPRTNEAHLLVNTGSSAVNKACPGGVCPQYVDITNAAVAWPTNVDAHSAKIVFWNNAPNILRPPVCSFNTSAGSIANGDSVVLSWNVTNTLSTILTEPTAT